MFVPVACLKCGKLFQVPAAAAGTEVACPWCKGITPALPVAAVPDAAPPASAPAPLSLDDAEPESADAPPRPPFRFPLRTALVALLVTAGVGVGVVAVLGYGAGRVAPAAWAEFTPPDGSCTVLLPGAPDEEPVEPQASTARGGLRYVTTGWYSGVSAWVGWQDLDPAWAKEAAGDRDGVFAAAVLAAERDRRVAQVGGTAVAVKPARFGYGPGMIVEMQTPRGPLVEQYVLAPDGPRPRLYFVGVRARTAAADGPLVRKLFNSFRVNKN